MSASIDIVILLLLAVLVVVFVLILSSLLLKTAVRSFFVANKNLDLIPNFENLSPKTLKQAVAYIESG